MKKEYVFYIALGILALIIVSKTFKGISSAFGLENKKEKDRAKKLSRVEDGFASQTFYDWYFSEYGKTWDKKLPKQTEKIAAEINQAARKNNPIWNDEKIIASIYSVKNKGQAALLNRYMRESFQRDLTEIISKLKGGSDVLIFLNNLPLQ